MVLGHFPREKILKPWVLGIANLRIIEEYLTVIFIHMSIFYLGGGLLAGSPQRVAPVHPAPFTH